MTEHHQKGRLACVFIFFVVLFSIIIIRLYLLQIIWHDFFVQLATQQYGIEVTMQPARGLIYDRTQKQSLVYNSDVTSVFVVPNQLEDEKGLKNWLARTNPHVLKRLVEHPHAKFCWIERSVAAERLDQLVNENLRDLHYVTEGKRFYRSQAMAPVLGFTNIDNLGIAGVELLLQNRLGGKPATFKLDRDARSKGFYFTKEMICKGVAGKPVVLTIDSHLQFLAHEELAATVQEFGAKSGAVIIVNPDNGQILTMASVPTFDPNAATINLDATKNQPVTECYEFGSAMKAFTALAALEEGVVTNDELIDCQGKACYINGLRIENPVQSSGIIPFIEVITRSANVGTAKVALRLGSKLHEHLCKLGFGKPTGLAFPGERSGFVNHPKKWSRFSPMVMSFGYEVSATLLQLAKAFSIIANGGYDVEPQLYLVPKPKKIKKKVRLYKPATIAAEKEILERIGAKYSIPGYKVLGKTGTARCVKEGKYSTNAHIYTFAGIIEVPGYRRVVVTFINEPDETVHKGLWASRVSAPLFQRIAQKMVLHERV